MPRPIFMTRSQPTSAIPTVNAWGKLYSSPRIRPTTCRCSIPSPIPVSYLKMSPRDPDTPQRRVHQTGNFSRLPSPYWGDETIWNSQTTMHNPDVRSGRTRLVHRPHPQAGEHRRSAASGSEPSLGLLFPMEQRRTPAYDVRSQDQQVHPHRPLLFDASSDLSPRMPTIRCGSLPAGRAPVLGWFNTKKFLDDRR